MKTLILLVLALYMLFSEQVKAVEHTKEFITGTQFKNSASSFSQQASYNKNQYYEQYYTNGQGVGSGSGGSSSGGAYQAKASPVAATGGAYQAGKSSSGGAYQAGGSSSGGAYQAKASPSVGTSAPSAGSYGGGAYAGKPNTPPPTTTTTEPSTHSTPCESEEQTTEPSTEPSTEPTTEEPSTEATTEEVTTEEETEATTEEVTTEEETEATTEITTQRAEDKAKLRSRATTPKPADDHCVDPSKVESVSGESVARILRSDCGVYAPFSNLEGYSALSLLLNGNETSDDDEFKKLCLRASFSNDAASLRGYEGSYKKAVDCIKTDSGKCGQCSKNLFKSDKNSAYDSFMESYVAVWTDNECNVLVVFCLSNGEKVWALLSSEKTVDAAKKEAVSRKVEELGLKKGDEFALNYEGCHNM